MCALNSSQCLFHLNYKLFQGLTDVVHKLFEDFRKNCLGKSIARDKLVTSGARIDN